MLVLKSVSETEKNLAHINVFNDKQYLGYLIKNNSQTARVGENWNFVSKVDFILNGIYGKTKKETLSKINLQVSK